MDKDTWNPMSNPPKYSDVPVWYEVKYRDGLVSPACWWWDHWYCNGGWYDIVAWRILTE